MPGGRCCSKAGSTGSRWRFRRRTWISSRPRTARRATSRSPSACRRCCSAFPATTPMPTTRRPTARFYRQTVLPLVARTARGAVGLARRRPSATAPAVARRSTSIEACRPSARRCGRRIGAADFLSDDEKREAVGYRSAARPASGRRIGDVVTTQQRIRTARNARTDPMLDDLDGIGPRRSWRGRPRSPRSFLWAGGGDAPARLRALRELAARQSPLRRLRARSSPAPPARSRRVTLPPSTIASRARANARRQDRNVRLGSPACRAPAPRAGADGAPCRQSSACIAAASPGGRRRGADAGAEAPVTRGHSGKLETMLTASALARSGADGDASRAMPACSTRSTWRATVSRPGAFARASPRRGAAGVRMLWQHDPAEPIGVWTTMSGGSARPARRAAGSRRPSPAAREALALIAGRRARRAVDRLPHRAGARPTRRPGCAILRDRPVGDLARHLPDAARAPASPGIELPRRAADRRPARTAFRTATAERLRR